LQGTRDKTGRNREARLFFSAMRSAAKHKGEQL
jgi:hypothetical protein